MNKKNLKMPQCLLKKISYTLHPNNKWSVQMCDLIRGYNSEFLNETNSMAK
jgi:hypothetical protein